MKGINKILFMFLVCSFSIDAKFAYADSAQKCNENIDLIIEFLNDTEAKIPFVPPDEAEYLEKEYNAWFQEETKNHSTGNRYALLVDRPYFHAWKLHSNFDKAKDSLQTVKNLPLEANVKTKIKTASMIPFDLSNARDAWQEYANYKGGKNLADSDQAREGAYKLVQLAGKFGFYLDCLAEQIPE